MNAFIERTGADELMLTSQMYDHAARCRSCELMAGLRTNNQLAGEASGITSNRQHL